MKSNGNGKQRAGSTAIPTRGVSSFTQRMRERAISQVGNSSLPSIVLPVNSNNNNNNIHNNNNINSNSASLISVGGGGGGGRVISGTLNTSLPHTNNNTNTNNNNNNNNNITTPTILTNSSLIKGQDLMHIIDSQRRDLQARTDSVNAIQRNFERLSEMYRNDKCELEQLRKEVLQLREKEAASESERKVLAAMRAELESLLTSHKELHKSKRKEQEILLENSNEMQQRLHEQEKCVKELQENCENLRNALINSEEKFKCAKSETRELTHKVEQFVTEVRGRMASLSIEEFNNNNNNNNNNNIKSSSKNNNNNNSESEKMTKALSDAWDCVDAICIAWRLLNLSHTQNIQIWNEQKIQESNFSFELINKYEELLRKAITQEETSQRENIIITNHYNNIIEKMKNRYKKDENSLLNETQEKLREAQHEIQQQKCKYEEVISNMKREIAESQQQQLNEYKLKREKEKSEEEEEKKSIRDEFVKIQEKIQNEYKEQKEKDIEAAVTKAKEEIIKKSQQEKELALKKLTEELHNEYIIQEKILQNKIYQLEKDIKECTANALAADQAASILRIKEKTESKAAAEMERDIFNKELIKIKEISAEKCFNTIIESETLHRETIIELEVTQRENLQKMCIMFIQIQNKIFKKIETVKTQTLLLLSSNENYRNQFRDLENNETYERVSIITEAWEIISHTIIDFTKSLNLQKEEEQKEKEKQQEKQLLLLQTQQTALKSLQTKLQTLRVDCADVSYRLWDALQKNRTIISEALTILQKLKYHHAPIELAVRRLVAAAAASESDLACGVCLQICQRPLTCAPCGHTFCEKCLLQHPQNNGGRVFNNNNNNNNNTPLNNNNNNNNININNVRFCPECRLASCNAVVRVRALEILSGNFMFRQKEATELHRALASLT